MKSLKFAMLLTSSLGLESHGCIQRLGTAADGSRIREHLDVSYQVHKVLRESMVADLPKEGARWEAVFRGKTSFPARNDYRRLPDRGAAKKFQKNPCSRIFTDCATTIPHPKK